jgi:hypothetical protein
LERGFIVEDPKNIKNGQGRPKKNKWTSEILSEMEIDEIFIEIPKDFMIKVHRKEPEWCSGYLGTIHFDPERPFNIDKLKEKFGGGLFTLQIVDESHKYRGQKTIRIADVPKENYQELDADFLTMGGAQRRAASRGGNKDANPFPMLGGMGMNMPGVPVEVQRKLMRWYLLGDEGDKKTEKANTAAEIMQQKLMMEMMQAQSQHQMAMQRHQLEYERELEKMRKSRDPKEPLGDVQQTIALLRELNGMKTEFGGSEHVATEIIGQTAPILETALTELLALQKLKVQNEIAKAKGAQQAARPLPPRQPPPRAMPPRPSPPPPKQTEQHTTRGGHPVSPPPITQPLNGSGRNPLDIAREMGAIYRNMGDEEQQALLLAFIGDSQQTDVENDISVDEEQEERNNNSDTVMSDSNSDASDLLDPEDQAVLESADETDEDSSDVDSEHETDQLSDGVDTRTTEIDDPLDREGNPLGSGIPAD